MPYRALASGMIARAMLDLVSTHNRAESSRETAWQWLFEGGGTITFEACCEFLDLDPESVRAVCMDEKKLRRAVLVLMNRHQMAKEFE